MKFMFFKAKEAIIYLIPSKTGMVVIKAMDDIGVVMTPFGDIVTVILVVNSYAVWPKGYSI